MSATLAFGYWPESILPVYPCLDLNGFFCSVIGCLTRTESVTGDASKNNEKSLYMSNKIWFHYFSLS